MSVRRARALALLLLAAAACGTSPPAERLNAAPTRTAPAHDEPGRPRPVTTPGEASSTTRPRGDDGARTGSGERKPGSQSSVEPVQPAAAGRYAFDTDGSTQVADGPPRAFPEITTLLVEAPNGSTQRTTRDLRDEDGSGSVIEQVLSYDADGVRLASLRIRTTFAGIARTYTFEPSAPPLVLRTGARPGDRARFTLSGNGVTSRTEVTVERTDTVRIDGGRRAVLVVRLASTFSGEIEGTQVVVNSIDRALSLPLREDVRSDFRQGAVRVRSAYVAKIASTRPS